ncbi:MAG: pyridoxal phosphate-dependent aminotransferase [Deltaproteobacteria bacterium]|nr:pyridoxal phosphate-dependent aminotransferase [Deltaproteobacteria bacterium]
MPTLSARGLAVPPSPIRKLVPLADAAKARGVKVFHLNIGQPDIETPAVMRDALRSFDEKVVAYSPSGGTDALRRTLLDYYAGIGVTLTPDQLLVTTGGSEAIHFGMAAAMDPGDVILVPDPMYANYISLAAVLGVTIVPVPTRVEDGYRLPLDWEPYLTPKVKGVLLCNPSNPTGAVYSADELQAVVDFVIRHDLYLFADEVYREFVYEGPLPPSLLTVPALGDRLVVVDSLSKRYSLCGARVGCLVTRNAGIAAGAMRLAQARLSPPLFAQLLGSKATALAPDYFEATRETYRRRRDIVVDALQAMPGVVVARPEGAFYCMARLPVDDAEAFARFMLESFSHEGHTTMVAPGGGFYAQEGRGRDEVRIAYVLDEGELRAAMECLRLGLEAYNAR